MRPKLRDAPKPRFSGVAVVSLVLIACSSSRAGGPSGSDAGRDAARDASNRVDSSSAADARPDAPTTIEGGFVLDGSVPRLLSETGLYSDLATGALGDGVRTYTPQGVLWADGADKNRWVYLPPGTVIETSDMDHWVYPVGTKVWKEFSLNGVRLETRMIEKIDSGEGDWALVAYQWNADLTDAVAVPGGVPNAAGTDHDIPSTSQCHLCHDGVPDDVLGFTALQLSHTGEGVTLQTLIDEHSLTSPPAAPLVVPGDDAARTALIYLHANCGQCHNTRSIAGGISGVRFFLEAKTLGKLEDTSAYVTATAELAKSHAAASADMIVLMNRRGSNQMPPLATKDVDTEGVAEVTAWLTELLRPVDGGTPDSGATPDAGGLDAGHPDARPDAADR